MSLQSILGQSRAKRFLKGLVRKGRIPHALLFSGLPGTGKRAMAHQFAKLINCLEPDEEHQDCCDRCLSCRKIDGGLHPDFLPIRKDGALIKIEQIREVQGRLRYRPTEARWRVMVIEEAQTLREEAGNALLKVLEEPPRLNLFVLTVPEPQMLLPTLVSRCCQVRFQPLEDSSIEDHLVNIQGLEAVVARDAARLAQGSLDRALKLAQSGHLDRTRELITRLMRLCSGSMLDFFVTTEQWAKKSEDLEGDMECIRLWLRDLLLFRITRGQHHPAFASDDQTIEAVWGVPVETLFSLYDQSEQAVQHLRGYANKQLTLEGLCLAIKDELYGYGKGCGHPVSHRRESLSF